MSKGPGHIQRRALALFENNPGAFGTARTVAAIVYEISPDANGVISVTAAQASAVRRALMALHKLGKIRPDGFRNGGQAWVLNDGQTRKHRSDRAVARAAGVSPATVSRLRRDESL